MNVAQLRNLKEAVPFRPFELRTVDGRVFRVPAADSIWLPNAATTCVIGSDSAVVLLDTAHITAAVYPTVPECIGEIKKALETKPFQPFALRMDSGEKYDVLSKEAIALSPVNDTVILADGKRIRILETASIKCAEALSPERSGTPEIDRGSS